MSNSNIDVVCEGWLTKSPPSKGFWKARWRRRWFVLRHSGELPGQFLLMYYTDKNCRKLKGIIDLDQCDQVDAGLRFENSHQNYPHMFDLQTPKRTYYLAAESEMDMNKWVDCVCQVCGLKATIDDNSVECIEESTESVISSEIADTDTPPISPLSLVSSSGPYIPISECHSGKPLNNPKAVMEFNNIVSQQALNSLHINNNNPQVYKNKVAYKGHTICADDISKSDTNKPIALPIPPNSLVNKINPPKKMTNIESAKKLAANSLVASDDCYDRPRTIVPDSCKPQPNWDTFPGDDNFAPGEIGSWSVVEKCGKLKVVDSKLPFVNTLNRYMPRKSVGYDTYSLDRQVAPPRPPKPSHLVTTPNDSSQSQNEESQGTRDETYDVPRSHQPEEEEKFEGDEQGRKKRVSSGHVYSNARRVSGENIFKYDFPESKYPANSVNNNGEPISPLSTQSNGSNGPLTPYSNVPSPHTNNLQSGLDPTPPVVDRGLKPTRKTSDADFGSSDPSPSPSPSPFYPPHVDRTLKPKKLHQVMPDSNFTGGPLKLCRPPDGHKRSRAGPTPMPRPTPCDYSNAVPVLRSSSCADGSDDAVSYPSLPVATIQYLDLDHEAAAASGSSTQQTTSVPVVSASTTVYNTVDFIKTKAFHQTRMEVEVERNKCVE